MSTAISVLGGVGLFLLGMTVMTAGLKALAGSALRTVLSKGGSDTAARLVLGRRRHAPGAIVQCNHHDDYRSRQRWLVDVPAGIGPRLRCERRHDGYRLAGRTCRRSRLAYGRRTADDLRRRPDQASGPRSGIRGGCGACRVWACTFWTHDPVSRAWAGWPNVCIRRTYRRFSQVRMPDCGGASSAC